MRRSVRTLHSVFSLIFSPHPTLTYALETASMNDPLISDSYIHTYVDKDTYKNCMYRVSRESHKNCMYRVSHESRKNCMYSVPWVPNHERTVFDKTLKNAKEDKLLQIMCFQSKVLEFLPLTSRYGATLFTLSTVKSYGDVATLTWQRKRDVFISLIPVSCRTCVSFTIASFDSGLPAVWQVFRWFPQCLGCVYGIKMTARSVTWSYWAVVQPSPSMPLPSYRSWSYPRLIRRF
jgi:hypothetical protein